MTKLGMSDVIGTIHLGGEHSSDEVFLGRDFNTTQNYSEKTAALIDEEIKKIIDEAYKKAIDTLLANRDKLDFVTEFLVKHEVMDGDEFEMAMNGASMEDIEAKGAERRKKSEEENALREAHLKAEREREEEDARRREEEENANRQKDENNKNDDRPRFPWEM